MKKYLTLILLMCLVGLSYGQNKIINYEYWFDGDYSNKSIITVAPIDKLDVNSTLSTTGLSDGLHCYNIRFKDDAGAWSSTLSQFFYKIPNTISVDKKIAEYEVWIDNDYANKTKSTVSPTDNLNVNTQLTTTGLSDGLHCYNIRFKDDAGAWSSTLSQFFYKVPSTISVDKKIAEYEVWLDNDYANKTKSNVSPTDNLNVNTQLTTTGLSDGLHCYNIRFKDDAGAWSSTLSQFFYKVPSTISVDKKIEQYEVWFDTDYANKTTTTVAPTDNLDVNSAITTNGLNDGIHTINFRFKDNTGAWSSVLSQFYYKQSSQAAVDNFIVGYRYWLNDNFSQKTYVAEATPAKLVNINTDLTTAQIPIGQNYINFQFLDTKGMWSLVSTTEFENTVTVNIIDNTFNNNFVVYPNPTSGKVFVDLQETLTNANVSIYDISGKLVHQFKFTNQKLLEFDIDNRPGIYFMVITSDERKTTIKLTRN